MPASTELARCVPGGTPRAWCGCRVPCLRVVGVGLVNRLDAEAERLRRKAKSEGKAESFEAHAADALVAMTNGEARPGAAAPRWWWWWTWWRGEEATPTTARCAT